MINDKDDKYDVYKISMKPINPYRKYIKKYILIIISLIIVTLILAIVTRDIIKSVETNKDYEKYQLQIEGLKKEEEAKEAEIEAQKEAERQAKIPKLTEERKSEYGKYLSLRYKKSIFNF